MKQKSYSIVSIIIAIVVGINSLSIISFWAFSESIYWENSKINKLTISFQETENRFLRLSLYLTKELSSQLQKEIDKIEKLPEDILLLSLINGFLEAHNEKIDFEIPFQWLSDNKISENDTSIHWLALSGKTYAVMQLVGNVRKTYCKTQCFIAMEINFETFISREETSEIFEYILSETGFLLYRSSLTISQQNVNSRPLVKAYIKAEKNNQQLDFKNLEGKPYIGYHFRPAGNNLVFFKEIDKNLILPSLARHHIYYLIFLILLNLIASIIVKIIATSIKRGFVKISRSGNGENNTDSTGNIIYAHSFITEINELQKQMYKNIENITKKYEQEKVQISKTLQEKIRDLESVFHKSKFQIQEPYEFNCKEKTIKIYVQSEDKNCIDTYINSSMKADDYTILGCILCRKNEKSSNEIKSIISTLSCLHLTGSNPLMEISQYFDDLKKLLKSIDYNIQNFQLFTLIFRNDCKKVTVCNYSEKSLIVTNSADDEEKTIKQGDTINVTLTNKTYIIERADFMKENSDFKENKLNQSGNQWIIEI